MKKYIKTILCTLFFISQASFLSAQWLPKALPAAATILTVAAWIAHKTNEIYQPHQLTDEELMNIEYIGKINTRSLHKSSLAGDNESVVIPILHNDLNLPCEHTFSNYSSQAMNKSANASRDLHQKLYNINMKCEPYINSSRYLRLKTMYPHHIPALATYLLSMALPSLYPNLQKHQARGLWATIGLASLSLAYTGYKKTLNYTDKNNPRILEWYGY